MNYKEQFQKEVAWATAIDSEEKHDKAYVEWLEGKLEECVDYIEEMKYSRDLDESEHAQLFLSELF